ncbi:glutamin-(asparagin-)ase [Solimonas aquatica]|uniref:Glutamin-(Asparagin-)ase n=1 Tax=Solimonas aquatica TaxID=489703 RepID=A0A1H9AG70_9GAMM|nr:asparaginase [Solimonas aquatica]SEP75734.1 glutamin-(asparagin-)ase [Solimonas aquatica]
MNTEISFAACRAGKASQLPRHRLLRVLLLSAGPLLAGVATAQEIPRYAPPPPMPAANARLPTVVLMSMGGTIASRGAPRLNITNYGGKDYPRVDPQDWVNDLPEIRGIANIVLEDQRAPQERASSETHEDFARVARRLNELARDPKIDGIVVTHGTNTMAETAYYMNLVVKTDKPIVFVGSQRPWTGLSGDGPRNLYDAVRVAASPQSRGKGVLHAMNQFINPARDVNKSSAYRVQTFRGIDVGAIGFVDPDKVVFYREPVRRHTSGSEFAGNDYQSLPRVEVAYAYRDAPGYLIDAMVANGARGIVVEGTGAGSPTSDQTEAIKRAQAKGVVVVATARTEGGRVQDTPRRREARIVPGDNLVPEKARILLQLALTKTQDLGEVKRIFDEY